jgi:hypothetical protein
MLDETIKDPESQTIRLLPNTDRDDIIGQKLIQCSMPAVGPSGEIYVVWVYDYLSTHNFRISKSVNGGITWSTPVDGLNIGAFFVDFVGNARILPLPSLTVASNGELDLVYTDYKSSTDFNYRVKFSRSTNSGTNWSTPVIIGEAPGYQYFGSITTNQSGRISVGFMHSPNPTGYTPEQEAWIATSDDNGTTWNKEKLSNVQSYPYTDYIHFSYEYMGIASIATNKQVYQLWTDHRGNNDNPYFISLVDVSSSVLSNWNITSLPDTTFYTYYSTDYPSPPRISGPFEYLLDNYSFAELLSTGQGYWTKFNSNNTLVHRGVPAYGITLSNISDWNLIGSLSVPFPTNKIQIIPDTIERSPFFEYDGTTYRTVETIVPGKGYWVKLSSAGTLKMDISNNPIVPEIIISQPPPLPGAPLAPVLLSPVNGATGVANPPTLCWNESETATSYNVQVGTSSAFTTVVYQASNITYTCSFASGLSYSTTYYWRVKAVNQFNESNWSSIRWFTTQSAPPPDPDPDPCLTSSSISALDEFTVVNGDGNKQTLYAKNGKHKLDVGFTNFDMPPEPIGGIFHAKFKTDKFIENIPPGKGLLKIPIKVKNAQYPITVNWKIKEGNGVKYWISKSGDDKDKQPLTGNGSIGLGSTKDGDIIIIAQAIDPCGDIEYKSGIQEGIEEQLSQLPEDYKLEQNTPNPFNPSTIINYQLPIDNYVTIKVYNILGEEIATLIDDMQDAGYKSVMFDGSNFSSGIYFVRMNSGSYNDVKKIVLAK